MHARSRGILVLLKRRRINVELDHLSRGFLDVTWRHLIQKVFWSALRACRANLPAWSCRILTHLLEQLVLLLGGICAHGASEWHEALGSVAHALAHHELLGLVLLQRRVAATSPERLV